MACHVSHHPGPHWFTSSQTVPFWQRGEKTHSVWHKLLAARVWIQMTLRINFNLWQKGGHTRMSVFKRWLLERAWRPGNNTLTGELGHCLHPCFIPESLVTFHLGGKKFPTVKNIFSPMFSALFRTIVFLTQLIRLDLWAGSVAGLKSNIWLRKNKEISAIS